MATADVGTELAGLSSSGGGGPILHELFLSRITRGILLKTGQPWSTPQPWMLMVGDANSGQLDLSVLAMHLGMVFGITADWVMG